MCAATGPPAAAWVTEDPLSDRQPTGRPDQPAGQPAVTQRVASEASRAVSLALQRADQADRGGHRRELSALADRCEEFVDAGMRALVHTAVDWWKPADEITLPHQCQSGPVGL